MSQQSSIKLSEYALILSNGISNGGDKPVSLYLLPEHMPYRRIISELIHRCICLNPAANTLDELSAGVNELSDYASKAGAEIAELKAKIAELEKQKELPLESTGSCDALALQVKGIKPMPKPKPKRIIHSAPKNANTEQESLDAAMQGLRKRRAEKKAAQKVKKEVKDE